MALSAGGAMLMRNHGRSWFWPKHVASGRIKLARRRPQDLAGLAGGLLAAILLSYASQSLAQGTYADSRCSFQPSSLVSVGTNPYSVTVAEINGDGIPDIAAANEGSNNVSILLGMGAGSFAAASQLPAGIAPRAVLLVDISGDGKIDLVVANSGSNTVGLRLGSGAGTFGSQSSLGVGSGPRALASADLDKDGKADLVVANANSNTVSVLISSGGGAFAAASNYAVGTNASGVVIADFSADGNLDLAVANEGNDSVSILLGNGAGGFATATSVAVGSQPRSLVAGDLNLDGKPDLAVANWNSGTVSVLLGSGGGAFGPVVHYPASALPAALATADFDGDGIPEIGIANETSLPNIVTVLRGLAAGSFSAPTKIPVAGIRPRSLATGDFNADGSPDMAVAEYGSNEVVVLLTDCAPAMNLVARADVDLNSSYQLRKSPIWFDRTVIGAYTSVAIQVDLDRNGATDVLRASISASIADGQTTPVQVLMNTGSGTFIDQTAAVIPVAHPPMLYPRKGLTGDYNDDGWPDLLVLDTGLDVPPFPGEFSHLYLSDGGGMLHYSPALKPYIGFMHSGASADVDDNGTVDVLMSDATDVPFFLINDGLGHLSRSSARLPIELLSSVIYTTELVDIDQDGYIDLMCAGNEFVLGQYPVVIYWGSSTGLYRASSKTVIPKPAGNGGVLDFAVEDINNDGIRDLIISRFADNFAVNNRFFQILRQASARQFIDETASRITMNTAIESFDFFRVQDINGDAAPDIFIDNKAFQSVGEYAWTNNGQGVFVPYAGPVTPVIGVTSISIADMQVSEGNSGTRQLVFAVRLNRPAPSTVSFNIATGPGTATAGSDYVAKATSGLTIPIGQSEALFIVTINSDSTVEDNEAFSVGLANVVGAKLSRGQALGWISNDDVRMLSIADVALTEGNAGSSLANFTVNLSQASPGPVSFDIFTDAGTAAPGTDFASNAVIAKTIAAGQSSASLAVAINGDTVVEGHETFTVNLANAQGAVIGDGQAQGRIFNDDLASLSISDASSVEGNSGSNTLSFLITLSQPMPNPVGFDIATVNGTASAGSDYVSRSQAGRFLDAGRTSLRFEVAVIGDSSAEPNETLGVTVSNITGAALADGSAVGTILNDDAAAFRSNSARGTTALPSRGPGAMTPAIPARSPDRGTTSQP